MKRVTHAFSSATRAVVDSPRDRPATAVLVAAVAGCVDAVGVLAMGGYFLSFMSGTVTKAGMAAVDRFWGTAGLGIGVVLLFVGGAAAGTLIGARIGRARAPVLLLTAALLVGATAWASDRIDAPGLPTLVMAMGLLNTAWVGRDGRALGVTYVTGALVRIGEAIGGNALSRATLGHDVALTTSLASGVVAGARFFPEFGLTLLWGPAALLLAAAAIDLVADRRVGP